MLPSAITRRRRTWAGLGSVVIHTVPSSSTRCVQPMERRSHSRSMRRRVVCCLLVMQRCQALPADLLRADLRASEHRGRLHGCTGRS